MASPCLLARWSTPTMTLSSKQDPLSPKSQPKLPVHPWQLQTLRFAAKCSGTSPTPWTTQTSATKSKLRVKNSTGCGRTGLSARRAEISSTTLCQSPAALLGAIMLPPSWTTGLQNRPRVVSGDVRVWRDELNRLQLRGGAKQSRTSSKLPSSFNAETEHKTLCILIVSYTN